MKMQVMLNRRSSMVLMRLRGAPKAVERAIPHAWDEAGGMLRERLVQMLTTGARNGRLYRYRGRAIRASAPGEPPAKRSGRLARSVEYRTRGAQMEFGETAAYAGYLEDGTRNKDGSQRMAPRPHVSRVVKTTTGDVYQILARHISEASRRR